jgi:GR25 family glycosyltransferase involved in LPS biosynthesis
MRLQVPPIFVISLKTSDRRDAISKSLRELGLDFTYIDTTDGRLVGADVVDFIYDSARNARQAGRSLSRGEIFCAVSHMWVYRHMVQNNIPVAVVLEDDAQLTSQFANFLRNIKSLPKTAEVIQFYSGFGNVKAAPSFSVSGIACHKAVTPLGHAVAYMIRISAAATISAENPKIWWVPDWPVSRRQIQFYVTLPWVVGHSEVASTLEAARQDHAHTRRKPNLFPGTSLIENSRIALDLLDKRVGYISRRIFPGSYIKLSDIDSDSWRQTRDVVAACTCPRNMN